MRERLTHLKVQRERNEIEEMMDSYIVQWENARGSGERDLPKYLQTKLAEQKHERQDKALAKASSPPKGAEIAPTRKGTTASISTSILAIGKRPRKRKRE